MIEKVKDMSAMDNYHAFDPERRHNEQSLQYSGENIYYITTDTAYLKRKLIKGNILKGRIVLCLKDNKYLLRFLGNNFLMYSPLKFERKDEVFLRVENTDPKLQFKILPTDEPEAKTNGKLDITI